MGAIGASNMHRSEPMRQHYWAVIAETTHLYNLLFNNSFFKVLFPTVGRSLLYLELNGTIITAH